MTADAKQNASDKLVGMKEISRYMGLSEATVLRRKEEYENFPIKKLGGIWVSSRLQIDRWIQEYTAS